MTAVDALPRPTDGCHSIPNVFSIFWVRFYYNEKKDTLLLNRYATEIYISISKKGMLLRFKVTKSRNENIDKLSDR